MPDFRGYQFDTVLNAVDDLGMDNTGGSSISSTLHDTSGGELVVFPDGDYLCDGSGFINVSSRVTMGFVAKAAYDAYSGGDTRDPYTNDNVGYDDLYTSNVNFQPDPDGGSITTPLIAQNEPVDLIVEGITLDHTNTSEASNDSGTLGMTFGLADSLNMDIRNIDHAGRAINYTQPGNEENAISAGTKNSNGDVLVHGCSLLKSHDESAYGYNDTSAGRIGFYTGNAHEGSIIYDNCEASEIGNNGWYCSGAADGSSPYASVTIQNCYVENCGASGFRIAGGNSKISNCEAVYDSTLYDGEHRLLDDGGSRPIVFETSNAGTSDSTQQPPGVTVENTNITMRPCYKPSMAIHAYQTARSVNIIDCEIDIDGVDMTVTNPLPRDGSGNVDVDVGWITRGPYNQAFGVDGPGVDPRHLNIDNTTVIVKNIPSSSLSTCAVAAIDADDDHNTSSTGTHIHNGTCIQTSGNSNPHDGVTVEHYDSNYAPFDATIENVTINADGSTVNNIGGNNITQSNIDTTGTCSLGSEDPTGTGEQIFTVDYTQYLS